MDTDVILYVTFDGVLQPLGFSQVVRVIVALGARGFRYHLLSVERSKDLENSGHVARVRALLASAGAEWTIVSTDMSRSARRAGEALSRVAAKAYAIASRQRPSLFHARGYQAAAIGRLLRRTIGVPYLFDARGCWIEERQDWFSRPSTYAAGKMLERGLYADATAVVTLTALHANDVVDGAFGRKDPGRVIAIPTCADYAAFDLEARAGRDGRSLAESDARRFLDGKLVLGIVGSLNTSYLGDATMALAKRVCSLSPRAHLLVLTQQQSEYTALVTAAGIPRGQASISSARHEDMPLWLPWIDWGLLLLTDRIAKRGSMPTKLAEFFAAGVRPVAYGCNSEMTGWVRRTGSGVVLEAVEDEDLNEAARSITNSSEDLVPLRRAREISAPHFSLASGTDRYERLLREIV